ncbi:serine/threonine-protein kinase [Paractinoplanes lichenicola]|uniref:non-specific serine/threonine protein kinase n=1 Tax=Paractinoplanes lichenicola TaxID=2802976 RepID=A0ABS1VR06_9ACTN|nr:serine/threonine-protein kinase [Actinoplanes lichenicola]MBL7257147.1 protein kinase [Actinoplanes lichenicola]
MGRTERKGQIGSLRIGRYRLVEKLGTGGMSEVWRAHDETLGRPVAVKVLSPRLAGDQMFRDRMRQEALAAARLAHPHITGIFDFGESPLDERFSLPYVVMELNDGESVASRLARQGPLPWRQAVTVAVEVASALATAHARGVVHRDVTPANVMLTGGGAKVVDFGISAIVGQCDAAPDGSLLGTPAYLAPERLGGSQVSTTADVYALGLLLYRSLSGRLPWPAETTSEALRAHLYADPEPLPSIAGMPESVADLCLRCLTKDPADRPTAADVARDLAVIVGVQPIIPPVTERAADAPEPVRGAAYPPAVVPRRRPGLGRVLLAYLGLPGGTPGPRPATRMLRLRAGLKIGAALRLGKVRPLGGGLFEGGRMGGGMLTGDALGFLRGRHRVQTALMTLALVATAGISWATTRDTPDVQEAQAAGSGVVAAGPSDDGGCAVRYQLRRDSGRDYEAQLTVATTEELAQSSWRVQFLYPGSQQLTGPSKAVTQKGRKVTAKGHGKLKSFTLRGEYRDYNPLPLTFAVDGVKCRAEVLANMPVSRHERKNPALPGTAEISEPRHNRPSLQHGAGAERGARKNGTPQKRVGSPTKSPGPTPTTKATGETGFSLAM